MPRSTLLSLLIPAVAAVVCTASEQTPENIRDLETAYHKFCARRGAALLPAFSKKLLTLQQQAVNRSDFEKAKQIQSILTGIKKDILSPPSPDSMDPFFTGKAWGLPSNKKHYVDSSLRLFKKELKEPEFQPYNQWVDPDKSSREIIIFTSKPSRIWFKKDDFTILQIYEDIYTDWFTVQNAEQNIPQTAGDDLNKLQQEFRMEYAKACKQLTRKYLEALNTRQKQLVRNGNMDEAIAIHEYMKKRNSGGNHADHLFKGTWKGNDGCLYDFSNKSKVAVKKPDGSLNFHFTYTFTSPGGEWKMARSDRGNGKAKEVIIFPVGENIRIVGTRPDSFVSILTRVPGS